MRTQTDREIIARFQTLFDTDGDFTKTAMNRGFENVGEGWLGIIDTMCARLLPIAPPGFRLLAIKSKYATLRVSYRGGNEAVAVEVAAAQAEALAVCELCGSAGEKREVGGYLAVRCRACAG